MSYHSMDGKTEAPTSPRRARALNLRKAACRAMSALIVLPCLGSTMAFAQASEPLEPQEMTDRFGVIDAIERGDAVALSQLMETSTKPAIRAFAEAGLYRVKMDPGRSNEAAATCISLSRRANDHVQELACTMIQVGNFLLEERPVAWATGVRHIRQSFYPDLRRQYGPLFALRQLENGVDLDAIAHLAEAAPPSATKEGDATDLPFHKIRKGELNPVSTLGLTAVDLLSGPTAFDAIPDTAGFMTLLNEPTARALGILPGPSWLSPARDRSVRSSLGVLPTLVIGHDTLSRVPVAVVSAATPNILGLSTLRRLGYISLSMRHMSVGGRQHRACSRPLTMRSDLIGTNAKVMIPIKVDGKPVNAVFDSGFDGELEQYGIVDPADLAGTKKTVKVATAMGQVDTKYVERAKRVDNGVSEREIVVRTRPSDGAVRYVAGMAILKGAVMDLDFVSGTACVRADATVTP
ncbi:hypothetical protein [Dyella terrae]|nr:hypothetical protein [Dyella terrae]TBR36277.1 hypothetical protein EYV96_16970 [Dyella terrae]